LLSVKNLNNGKAPGEDDIINKYIKSTVNQFLPVRVNLFNLIFSCGIIPDSWLIGIKKPIYKNKRDPNNLDNYRAICLTSTMGKLFTSILNSRLSKLSDDIGLISGVQVGFRNGYSGQDSLLSCIHLFPCICLLVKNYVVPLLTLRKLSTPCGELGFGKN
jgi:hypothetical protein